MADPPGTRGGADRAGDTGIQLPMARTRKETENRIETLLKRIKQQFSSQRPSEKQSTDGLHVAPRPPDPAATTLGRELAHAFVQTYEYPTTDTDFAPFRQRILDALIHRGIHPSLPHSFFVELALHPLLQQVQDAPQWQDWLPSFILQVEQEMLLDPVRDLDDANGLHETLAASLRAYARFSAMEAANAYIPSITGSAQGYEEYVHIMTTYRRLEGAQARTQLLREFARSFPELVGVRQHLSPLMAACVLALWSTPSSERTIFVDLLFRNVWDHIYATEDFTHFWGVFNWMTDSLNILLLVLPSAGRIARDQLPSFLELAQRWLMELGDLLAFAVNATGSEEEERKVAWRLHQWLNVVLNKTLPALAMQCGGYYRLSLEPLLEMLNGLIIELDMPQVETSVVFRLATIALVTPVKRETRSILALFSYLLPSSSPATRGITSALGAVFIPESECSAAATFLLKTKQGIDKRLVASVGRPIRNIADILDDDVQKYKEVLTFVAKSDTYALDRLSSVKQVEGLLLAIAFRENSILQKPAKAFLQNLIRRYPHLGLLLLPGLIEDMNLLSFEQETDSVLSQLELICDTCFYNPNCAQKTWKMIQNLLEMDKPLVIRVTVLRLLPRIVQTNKSMYRRVISTLGEHRNGKPNSSLSGFLQPDSMQVQLPSLEIKLAVIASISELAANDLILDVAEVIGWIQDFLCLDYNTDSMSALVVHFAVLAIHHLVSQSGELDFALVFKVLKKKLVDLTKLEDVRGLPLVVLESLVLYLGDGEYNADGSSESDGGSEVVVSPQVCASVQLLMYLGSNLDGLVQSQGSDAGLLLKVRRNIISSLSRYSPEYLGLEAEGIQAALTWYDERNGTQSSSLPQEASVYASLCKIASGELSKLNAGLIENEVIGFVQKILKFEEDSLSASLWKTRGTKHPLQHKLDFALLPSPQEGTILSAVLMLAQQVYEERRPEFLVRLIRCLECMSLPGHFAKLFVEPLLSEDDETIKTGCVSLLLSQISGRRRAAFDGSEWANLAMKIAISPMVSFQSLLGNGGGVLLFVQSLKAVIYCLPPAFPIDNVVDNLWDITLALSQRDTLMVIEFLKQFRAILQVPRSGEKQGMLSPKTLNFLHSFLVKKAWANARELFWGDGNSATDGAFLESFVSCLRELPLMVLEQNDFFRNSDADGFAGEVARLLGILELSRRGYFSEPTSSIMRALSWMSKRLVASGAEFYEANLRRMASAVAAASAVLNPAEQRDILLSAFEQLLLCHPSASSIGMDLLSVLVWTFSSQVATDGHLSLMYLCSKTTCERLHGLSDPALEQVFVFLRADAPHNLAAFGRREKIGAVISNHIWRLINAWSKHGADHNVLSCLRKAFICCCNDETKEEDFCALTASILFESDSTATRA